jgi:hypothetical protein
MFLKKIRKINLIACGTSYHAALDIGYDILLEKPMSNDPAECLLMAQKAQAQQRLLMICHVLRYTPFFTAIKQILDSGVLGEVVSVQHNENVRIAYNRIIANAGTNLAGGIGLFAGSDNYEVDHNDVCGNFSAEYGGGISHMVPRHDILSGAFTLAQSYSYYPPGTIHLAVVDPGVGSARKALAVSAGGHFFVWVYGKEGNIPYYLP